MNQLRPNNLHAPTLALISLDIKNAFGQVQWADALLIAVAQAPRLAVPMAMMWRDFQLEVHLRDEDVHGWHSFTYIGA